MTPYALCYAVLLLCCAVGLYYGRLRLAALAAFSAMFYLIAARGLVGVDSAFYVQQFDTIRYRGLFAGGFEPGFSLIIYSLTAYFADPFTILILLGCVAAAMMLIGAFSLEGKRPIFFISLVIPYFLLDMSMNGLRYGLAFALITIGTALWVQGRRLLFIACAVIAASLQVSSVLLAASVWALLEARVKTFVAVAVAGIGVFALFGEYLGEKASQNADLAALGGFSGVLPLLIGLLVLAVASVDRQLLTHAKFPIICLLFFHLASFMFSRYYYAGLRFQGVAIFSSYLVIAAFVRQSGIDLRANKLSTFFMMVVALFSSGSRLNNFYSERGVGISPFVPYYFASEVVM